MYGTNVFRYRRMEYINMFAAIRSRSYSILSASGRTGDDRESNSCSMQLTSFDKRFHFVRRLPAGWSVGCVPWAQTSRNHCVGDTVFPSRPLLLLFSLPSFSLFPTPKTQLHFGCGVVGIAVSFPRQVIMKMRHVTKKCSFGLNLYQKSFDRQTIFHTFCS